MVETHYSEFSSRDIKRNSFASFFANKYLFENYFHLKFNLKFDYLIDYIEVIFVCFQKKSMERFVCFCLFLR